MGVVVLLGPTYMDQAQLSLCTLDKLNDGNYSIKIIKQKLLVCMCVCVYVCMYVCMFVCVGGWCVGGWYVCCPVPASVCRWMVCMLSCACLCV